MKNLINGFVAAALLLQTASLTAQPVAKTDIVALLAEMPAAPSTLEDAYKRAYPDGATSADAAPFYRSYMSKLEAAYRENQMLQQQFYTKYPTGIRPQQQPRGASKASPQQESAMNAATAELAQKMLSDPEFAKKFSQMSEKEQHAYIAQVMADKGIKPVSGAPNTNTAPIPGTDVEWAAMCTDYSQAAMGLGRFEAHSALQQKYEARHQEVREWTEAEIKKLPMISFGEYGHDHDPEKVKAIRKQALAKHRDIAQAKLTEAAGLFQKYRQESAQRLTPLNNALKGVNYGSNYDFGQNYTVVIGTQAMMFAEPDALLKDEIGAINEAAQWEYEYRNFK